MPALRDLHCPAGCPDGRFEVLGAPVIVGKDGRYLGHDDRKASFACVSCQGVAIDLVAAGRAMRNDRYEPQGASLTCPACGTEMLPPEDDPLATLLECPACSQHFTVEEGSRFLHGGGGAQN